VSTGRGEDSLVVRGARGGSLSSPEGKFGGRDLSRYAWGPGRELLACGQGGTFTTAKKKRSVCCDVGAKGGAG